MTAKTKAQQDELSGPFTRAQRSAMVAIDKISAMEDEDWRERDQAMLRIQRYALTVRSDLRRQHNAPSALSWEASEAPPSPYSP